MEYDNHIFTEEQIMNDLEEVKAAIIKAAETKLRQLYEELDMSYERQDDSLTLKDFKTEQTMVIQFEIKSWREQ